MDKLIHLMWDLKKATPEQRKFIKDELEKLGFKEVFIENDGATHADYSVDAYKMNAELVQNDVISKVENIFIKCQLEGEVPEIISDWTD